MEVEIEIQGDLHGPAPGDQMEYSDVLEYSCWDDELLHGCQQGHILLPTSAVGLLSLDLGYRG